MSLSIVQVVFIFSTFLSFSKPNFVTALTSNSQLKKACNAPNVKRVIHPNLCLKILQSEKKIVLSTNQTDLAVAAIKSGISNGTNTWRYVQNMLKKTNSNPNFKYAIRECNVSYDSAVVALNAAVGAVKLGHYLPSTYELMIATTDYIDRCKRAVASKKIKDATILIGNKVLPMFGFIGLNVVDDLLSRSPTPPPSMFGNQIRENRS